MSWDMATIAAISDLAMSWGLSLSISGFVFLGVGAFIRHNTLKKPEYERGNAMVAAIISICLGAVLFVGGIIVLILG